jgi:PAS domain S-box-containing protein
LLVSAPTQVSPRDLDRGPFKTIFERSRVPMTLIDSERRRVAINDAALTLLGCRSDEAVGSVVGTMIKDDDPTLGDRLWDQLVCTNELYAEHLVSPRDGPALRVSFAAHATTTWGRWLALVVTLSARFEPDGPELIGTTEAKGRGRASQLTPREREVVRRIALGATNREIASDLFVSPATVRAHVRNVMSKTQARTRAQVVAIVLGDLAGFEDLAAKHKRAD